MICTSIRITECENFALDARPGAHYLHTMENKFIRSAAPGAVVIGRISEKTASRIADETGAAPVRDLNEPDTIILEESGGKTPQMWRQVNNIVGGEAVVVPILQDTEGRKLLPTGQIEVRFKEAPDTARLNAFAKRHALKLIGPNRWNPQQASFAIEPKDERFLLKITEALEADAEAETAWPDTRSAYQRSS
jgi:hypothetical protein